MEKFCTVDRFCTDPMLLFPVAHCIRICGTILITCSYKIMDTVIAMFLCKCLSKCIRCFLNFYQIYSQIFIQFFVIPIIFREFTCIVHKTVCNHKKLQLFIARICNFIIYDLCQFCSIHINKSKHLCSRCRSFFDTFHHLDGTSGYG